jgi:adenosylhomocysteine nucleosidase
MKPKILIITALESELDNHKLPTGVDWAYCGVGKINAALITLKAIQDFQPTKELPIKYQYSPPAGH